MVEEQGEESRRAAVRLRTTGRRGPVSAAVAKSLRIAPDPVRGRPSFAAYAQIAGKAADLVDAAWRAGDVPLVRSSMRELRTVLALMRLDGPGEQGAGCELGGDARLGGLDGLDLERELAVLVGAGPVAGDAADA